MRTLAMGVGVLLLAVPPLFFTLYLLRVDVLDYLERSLLFGMTFALPLLGFAAVVGALVVGGKVIAKILKSS